MPTTVQGSAGPEIRSWCFLLSSEWIDLMMTTRRGAPSVKIGDEKTWVRSSENPQATRLRRRSILQFRHKLLLSVEGLAHHIKHARDFASRSRYGICIRAININTRESYRTLFFLATMLTFPVKSCSTAPSPVTVSCTNAPTTASIASRPCLISAS